MVQTKLMRGDSQTIAQSELYEQDEVLQILDKAVRDKGSQEEFGAQIDVTPGYISNVLKKIRRPSKKLLDLIGFEPVVVYRKKKK